MLVPEIAICLSSKHFISLHTLSYSAAHIETPGERMSGLSNVCSCPLRFIQTTGPRELNSAISLLHQGSLPIWGGIHKAPTVIAFLEVPGLMIVCGSGPEFPAATTAVTPVLMALSIAMLIGSSGPQNSS